MSIEDEIRAEKEKIREMERELREAGDVYTAMKDAKMQENYPVVITPATELQPIIAETISKMRFSNPKIVQTMPDGRTFARFVEFNERPNRYSFDLRLYYYRGEDGLSLYEMWIFQNGTVSFAQPMSESFPRSNLCIRNLAWEDIRRRGIDATAVRTEIIRALAFQETSHFHKGCYIATAVYGSYDCPEVWVLRRYRDCFLENSVLGRLFIRIYYAVSPALVRWFGKKKWFKLLWRKYLDKKVATLRERGYSDDRYED